jgi:hypothetical protein
MEGCFVVAKRWRDVPPLSSLQDVRDWRDLEQEIQDKIAEYLKGYEYGCCEFYFVIALVFIIILVILVVSYSR